MTRPANIGASPSSPGALILNPADASVGKFFVVTADGRLFERNWDTTARAWSWHNHGTPPGTKASTAPGALILNPGDPSSGKFFLGTLDGRLFEHSWDAGRQSWIWNDHGTPPGTKVATHSGALILNPGDPSSGKFFVGTADGRLFEHSWDTTARSWGWHDHGTPPGTKVATAPGALIINPADRSSGKFFMGTADGRLFERNWDTTARAWLWSDHGTPDNYRVTSEPAGLIPKPGDASTGTFFVTSSDNTLYENLFTLHSRPWTMADVGGYDVGGVATAVCGPLIDPGNPSRGKVFMGTVGGALGEFHYDPLDGGSNGTWTNHGTPPGTKVATAPGAMIVYPGDKSACRFFMGCADGRVFERAWNETTRSSQWIDHGAPA